MDIVAGILATVGILITVASGIWYLVVTFQKGLFWGLGNLFVPFVGLVFLCMHFRDAWKPCLANVLGIVLVGAAAALYFPAHPELMEEAAKQAGTTNSSPYQPASVETDK